MSIEIKAVVFPRPSPCRVGEAVEPDLMSHLHRSTPFKAKGMANGVAGAGVGGAPHENGFLLAHTDTIEEIPMDASPRDEGECGHEDFRDLLG